MDVGGVLAAILVVLVAAKLAAEVSERIGVPAVVGEIVAGVLIGPSVLGLVEGGEVLHVLGELGVILLLLEVGMQMDLAELGAVGRASTLVACVGVAVPFAGGAAVTAALGHDANTAIFVGAALTATSVGITARVFGDLRALATVEARTVLGAAVVDDVLGLVILTVVVRIVGGGSVSALSVGGIVGVAALFLVGTTVIGARLAPPLFRAVHGLARSTGTLVALAFAFALGFAELASMAKLAPIVGAFVAGLCLARTAQADRIHRDLAPVGHLFIPVFFLQIGIDTDVSELGEPKVLVVAGLLLAVAVAGKLASAAGLFRSPGDRLLVGIGMIPRGEVGLIFAGLGLREGILGQDLYAAVLVVVLVTTLLAPPALRWRTSALLARRHSRAVSVPEPDGGWLAAHDAIVDLRADPPDHLALHIALRASLLARDARPGSRLLDWLGTTANAPMRWDRDATSELFEVLRTGSVRSWRLLEATGILERALPELAEVFRRRRADPFELDPAGTLRWHTVERLHEIIDQDPVARAEHDHLAHPDWLLLAALVVSAEDGAPEMVPVARQLVKRLDLGAAAEQEVALLVGESGLMRAVAARTDGLTERSVLQVASHVGQPERARALYLLSLALGDLDPVHRDRLDELHGLVQSSLAGESRRDVAASLAPTTVVRDRVRHAPASLVVTDDAAEVARLAALVEPPPRGRVARVAVTPAGPSRWRVDVASRDRPGLLAAITGVLAQRDLPVASAVVATWADGAAVDSFVVETAIGPEPGVLAKEIQAARPPRTSAPVPDAAVIFDDDGSPWYTLCRVEAPDKPGLLHALATALTTAGADVHSAKVMTEGGCAVDHFELTDRRGRKLDTRAKAAVVAAVSGDVGAARHR